MKSRKVKSSAKTKSFLSKKKLRGNIPIDVRSDSEADADSDIYNDEIDEFHQREDEKLSTDDELIDNDEDSSEEEEVLPITDDEKDNEWDNYDEEQDEKSDSEQKEDEDLPNPEAWGRKKSVYFNADFVDEDRGRTYREEDAEAAKAEAEEALAIQKSVLSSITTNNLGGNLQFGDLSEEEEEIEEEVNWQFVTKQEKIKFLKKTCPEFLTLIREFKEKLTEVKDKLIPLMRLVINEKIPSQDLAMYIKVKYHLLLHICMNISVYMMMKSKDSVVSSHPVLQRITVYKKLLDELENINETIPSELDIILEKLKQNEEISFEEAAPKQIIPPPQKAATNTVKSLPEKQRKMKNKQFETEAEKEIFSLYMDMKEQQKKENAEQEKILDEICEEPMDMEEDASGEKRTITYQIAKNKGLVPHRKKEYRNPRVRHRMKYRKAKIRRKGQIREAVRELKRYEGEP
ncbi:Something about silencing protein 10, partial [Stegodyphus mimosarum]